MSEHLLMVYLGGDARHSNIEVHDIQFVVCQTIDDAIPILKKNWYGDADSIHIDGYQCIDWADGYDVRISDYRVETDKHLFFVNLGGYRPDQLAEIHEFDLFVGNHADEVKERAKKQLLLGCDLQHKDNLKEVDNCLLLDHINQRFIHLLPNPKGQRNPPKYQGFHPI